MSDTIRLRTSHCLEYAAAAPLDGRTHCADQKRSIRPPNRRHKQGMKSIALALLAAMALIGATPQPASQPITVHIKNFQYTPQNLTVHQGDTVTFVNDDDEAHTVTATGKAFDSGGLDTNQSWQHAFKTKGKYSYFCEMHPYMKGSVTVI
jgi:plastocyanin